MIKSCLFMLTLFFGMVFGCGRVCGIEPLAAVKVRRIPSAISKDPVKFTKSARTSGILCYSFLRSFNPDQTAIVVRNMTSGTTATYLIDGFNDPNAGIYDARRSPNGRYIGFKLGFSAGSESRYKLYVLDVVNLKIINISNKWLDYSDFSWSPDSRYVAYVEGGNYFGSFNENQKEPIRLKLWEVQLRKERLVSSRFVGGGISWLLPHTVLYNAVPATKGKTAFRPILYSYRAEISKPVQVLNDCYKAVFSPNAKKVAYFGPEDPSVPMPLRSDWIQNASYMALCVTDRNNRKRQVLDVEDSEYPYILWSNDNRSLTTFKLVKPSPNSELLFTKWDIENGKKNEIFTLRAKDYVASERDPSSPQFVYLGSVTQNRLLFSVSEYLGEAENQTTLRTLTSIKMIDLQTGGIQTIGTSSKSLDFNWTPASSKLRVPNKKTV